MRANLFHRSLSVLFLVSAFGMLPTNGHDPSENAALQYWSALVSLPNDSRMTQWELASRDALTASIEDIEFLFSESGISHSAQWALDDLRRGAGMPYCEWGRLNQGPFACAHHAQRSRTAVGLLLLSARLEHSRGNWTGAVDDLNAAWTFSGHLAADRLPAGTLSHLYRVEKSLAPLTAAWLPQLDEETARRLRGHLEKLPAAPTLQEAGRAEQELWLNWIRDSVDRHGLEWLIGQLRSNGDLGESLEAALKNEQELASLLEETRELMDESVRVASVPDSELIAAATQFREKIAGQNPLAQLIMGQQDLVARRHSDSKHRVIMAMLRAAISLRLDGRDGFERILDPASADHFEYHPSADGYTLTSQLVIDREAVSMKFGRGAISEVDTVSKLRIYRPDSDPADDMRVASVTARREHKHILLQWGFNGCIPCYALHRALHESESLSEALNRHYVHVHVDVTQVVSEDLLRKYHVEMPGVPHLTVLRHDGQVVANVKPSEQLSVNGILDADLLLRFLEKWGPVVDGDEP